MKCNNCRGEWTPPPGRSVTDCPFCGKSITKKEEPKFYDNSRDALDAIMKMYGAEVLLGKLNAHFPDFAPDVPKVDKELVYDVFEKGAAQILKNNLNASPADREIAVKRAIQRLTEAYIAQDMAETIIYEFKDALGWKVNKPDSQNRPLLTGTQYKGTTSGTDETDAAWSYSGDLLNGIRHGFGKVIWDDGNVYEGDFVNDKFWGKGKLIHTDGHLYEGDFVNDSFHGKGKLTYANNTFYEGEFLNSKFHGKGKLTLPDGNIYKGEFENGNFHGKGKLTYVDGNIYEGDFVNGIFQGKGKLTYVDGKVKKGKWSNNVFMRKKKLQNLE